MEHFAFFEVFILLLISGSGVDLPEDALALLEPEVGLELLGKGTEVAELRRLVRPAGLERGGEKDGELPRELTSAIENLASGSGAIREGAREKLVVAGELVRARLEEVAATDARRAVEAKKVLAAIDQRGTAAAHEADMARILAMRLVAKKELAELVPLVREVAGNGSPFARRAAESVLARLGDRTPAAGAEGATSGAWKKELAALPPETRFAMAFDLQRPALGAKGGLTISSFFKSMSAGFPVPMDAFEEAKKETQTGLLEWVKAYGNILPERVVAANVGGVGPSGGGLGIIIRGLYQPAVLRASLEKDGSPWMKKEVEGVHVYESPILRLALLSDESVLLLPPEASERFPLATYLKNLRAGTEALAENARWATFLGTLDQPFQARGLALTDSTLMSEIQQEIEAGAPPDVAKAVKGMEEIEVTVLQDPEGKKTRMRAEAKFDSNENATALTRFVETSVQQGIAEMEQALQAFPMGPIKSVLDIMKSIRLTAEAKRGILLLDAPFLSLSEILTGTTSK